MCKKVFSVFVLIFLLAGCATLNPDLNNAATQATDAANTVKTVNREILIARVLNLVTYQTEQSRPSLENVVCIPSSPSVELTVKELSAYADAINLVGKVAAKPESTTYSGYLKQFKKNQAVIDANPTDPVELAKKDDEETLKAQKKCYESLKSDFNAKLTIPKSRLGGMAPAAALATIVSIDNLVKTVLASLEQAQREEAVRKTMADMLVVMEDATEKLKQPAGQDDYNIMVNGEAPKTRLENSLAIHRWIAAKRLQTDWRRLQACEKNKGCGANWTMWQAADTFVADIDAYRTLAAIDSAKLLEKLNKAVDTARDNNDKASLADILDSMSAIANALSGINDKYTAYRKTLN